MKAIALHEYTFIFKNGMMYASLELDDKDRVVKTMFLPASEGQEKEIREFLKTNS
jgi:hypothetical protein